MNVLVIGRAKTGTTIISKTIQKSLPSASYYLEPKTICFFEHGPHIKENCSQVVKIIFEQWIESRRLRDAFMYNETQLKFDRVIAIRRDLRDELLSRLLYVIFHYLLTYGHQPQVIQRWLELWQAKENAPQKYSIRYLIEQYDKLVGDNFLNFLKIKPNYSQFLQNHAERVFIIAYENFISGELDNLEHYLGFKMVRNSNVGQNLQRTQRSLAFNNWQRYFTLEDVAFFRPLLSDELTKLGYHDDWALTPVERLNPAHCSQYIKKLVREASERRSLLRQQKRPNGLPTG
ncbi:MAG: hypothetical protein SVR94_16965 [Pseudomonadota bacterium]|nr:hypothetical protein [Pseudomonadota bacterium]